MSDVKHIYVKSNSDRTLCGKEVIPTTSLPGVKVKQCQDCFKIITKAA